MRDVLGNEFYGCENSQCHYLIFVTLETHFFKYRKRKYSMVKYTLYNSGNHYKSWLRWI